jgi:hypothetical protein
MIKPAPTARTTVGSGPTVIAKAVAAITISPNDRP